MPRFRSLRARLLAAFLGVALVPLGVLAAWSLLETSRTIDRIARDALMDECAVAAGEFEKAIGATKSDLFFLSQLPPLRSLMQRHGSGADDAELAALAEGLAHSMAPKTQYAGASLVDATGNELVRVVRAKEAIQIVPPVRLRMLARDAFIAQGLSLRPGQVLVGMSTWSNPSTPQQVPSCAS